MSRSSLTPTLGLLGAAIQSGQAKGGVEKAPSLIRDWGLTSLLEVSSPYQVQDYGDLQERPQVLAPNYFDLFLKTRSMAKENDFTLTLGGDHSIALSTISGIMATHPQLKVIWVDAHGDINTPYTSPTGNLHGMPLALLLGIIPKGDLPGFEWVPGLLRPENVALVGVRSLDPGESLILEDLDILYFTASQVKDYGMKHVMSQVMNHLDPKGHHPIHLSFDIDALDPEIAPATGVPVGYGLGLGDLFDLSETLAETNRLVSADIVELNPDLAKTPAELESSLSVIFSLLRTLFVSHLSQAPRAGFDDLLKMSSHN